MRHTWAKGVQYLKKMGGTILVASIIVWALNYFPRHNDEADTATPTTMITDSSTINPDQDSYLEMMGKAINPAMEPIGFHWRATVAAIAGIPAKEIVVSTLGVLYTDNEAAPEERLNQRLKADDPLTGKPDFTSAAAISFLIFILLYCPCIATVTAIARESGSWKWGIFSVFYNTIVAWIVAFGAYHIALLF